MADEMKAVRRQLGAAFRWEALIDHHLDYAIERANHEAEVARFDRWFWPVGVALYAANNITEDWPTVNGLVVIAVFGWLGAAVAFTIRARRACRRLKALAPSGCRCAWFEGYEPDPGPLNDHTEND